MFNNSLCGNFRLLNIYNVVENFFITKVNTFLVVFTTNNMIE